MRAQCFGGVVLMLAAAVTNAAVLVEHHDEPLIPKLMESGGQATVRGGLVETPKTNQPATGLWFIPFYRADKLHDGDSTYFAIRNESGITATVLVEFFDVSFDLQASESYELDSREVKTVALRHVPGLPVDPDGYTRGFIRISAAVPVTVDYFQLETLLDFAVGGPGFVENDLCTRWNARFLKFGASGGTTLSMMINGPRGASASDPVTLAGDVYTEGGEYLGSFSIRTDEWALQFSLHDLLGQSATFGVVELLINATNLPSGMIEVQHRALGEFSVGHRAMCMD